MNPLTQAVALWRQHFPANPIPRHKLRLDGGILLADGVRIVRVSPPPRRYNGHQLQEVLIIEGMSERVLMRTGAWCER